MIIVGLAAFSEGLWLTRLMQLDIPFCCQRDDERRL